MFVTLVRTVDLQERLALQLRLDTLQTGNSRPGNDRTATLKIGHASSPDEGATPSDLLHLALTRLERGPEAPASTEQSKTEPSGTEQPSTEQQNGATPT